jgi:lycopene cyclase domain-containing protein
VTYTELGLLGVTLTVVLDLLVLRTRLLTRRVFWAAYAIVVCFQLVTNGVLTGFQIVRYNASAIIGTQRPTFLGAGRVAWAPVEDLLFGFTLVVSTLVLWVWWGRRGVQTTPTAGPPRGAFGSLRRRFDARAGSGEPPGPDSTPPRRQGDGQSA